MPMIQFNCSSAERRTDAITGEALIELAEERVALGFAPPAEIYRIEHRRRINWAKFPPWARPIDPEVFDRCCHEG
jgi:hypothetical protein